MLSEIRVHNFAIVENKTISLKEGMTVFTGETGAGKSLLLDAITLLLGAKADTTLVRSGESSAEVEGLFDWTEFPERIEAASEMGFSFDEEECFLVVRREISTKEKKRNRIWIQGKLATRGQLQKLLGDWVEISGQHEFLRLNKEEYILETLDQYAQLREKTKIFRECYDDFKKLENRLMELEKIESERQSLLDFRRFQLEEFKKAQVGPTLIQEEEELVAKRQQLANVEKIRISLQLVSNYFSGTHGENYQSEFVSINEQIKKVTRELCSWSNLGGNYEKAAKLSEEAQSILLELESTIEALTENIEADPKDLEEAEERLSQIAKLKRKYNVDSEGLFKLFQEVQNELSQIENSTFELKKCKEAFEKAQKELLFLAEDLHQKRVIAAQDFSKQWLKEVRSLGIKDAEIELLVSPGDNIGPNGISKSQVFFTANKGEDLKLISKVASGGELSRILLAMKYLISDRNSVGVYLFDEVDSGIGGETAHRVGQKLKFISRNNQVIVVSHLAQVAAYSDHHYVIEKSSSKARTQTKITSINSKEEKLNEISRMLGSSSSQAAKALAQELIQEAGI